MPKISSKQHIAMIEEEHGESICQVLQNYYNDGYGLSIVAQILGIHHTTLYRLEKKYNISLRRKTLKNLRIKHQNTQRAVAAAALVNRKFFMPNGNAINITQEAKRIGITNGQLRRRIKKWGAIKALSLPKMSPALNVKKARKNESRQHSKKPC